MKMLVLTAELRRIAAGQPSEILREAGDIELVSQNLTPLNRSGTAGLFARRLRGRGVRPAAQAQSYIDTFRACPKSTVTGFACHRGGSAGFAYFELPDDGMADCATRNHISRIRYYGLL